MIVLYNDNDRAEIELSIDEIKMLADSDVPNSSEWKLLYEDCINMVDDDDS